MGLPASSWPLQTSSCSSAGPLGVNALAAAVEEIIQESAGFRSGLEDTLTGSGSVGRPFGLNPDAAVVRETADPPTRVGFGLGESSTGLD